MKSEVKEGTLVISMETNMLGTQTHPVLMTTVLQNIESGNRNIVFNMGGINYVDSAGLGMLLSATSKIKSAGGKLVICNLSEQVQKLLKTTKVESVFRIAPDEASALASLKG
jgi:anti-anti-sigma factor